MLFMLHMLDGAQWRTNFSVQTEKMPMKDHHLADNLESGLMAPLLACLLKLFLMNLL